MAAATHPQVQAEVQAQLDSVISRDRGKAYCTIVVASTRQCLTNSTAVPTFDDEKLLPLVVAFYLETFRWRPISWGGK